MDKFTFMTVQGKTDVFYCDETFLPQCDKTNTIYIADTNTAPLAKNAANFCPDIPFVTLDAGEVNKNFTSLKIILQTALESGLNKNAVFIGIGGGFICDLTAFAASIYMRGAKCILVPTTLLAMADAAIGGKTAINFGAYKNMIGSFFKAEAIYISPQFLDTLSEKEYRSGLAEIFKMGLLYSPTIYRIFSTQTNAILNKESDLILEIIKRSVIAKSNIVGKDFDEKNERTFLNFGHTFGHALESAFEFTNIAHGAAVAWGISRALSLGKMLNLTNPDYVNEVCNIIEKFGWSTAANPLKELNLKDYPALSENFADTIIKAMRKDKKNIYGNIRVILQEDIESTFIYTASEQDIRRVLI